MRNKKAPEFQELFKLMSGLEPPTSSLPRMRATDCATSAVLVYNIKFMTICQSLFLKT